MALAVCLVVCVSSSGIGCEGSLGTISCPLKTAQSTCLAWASWCLSGQVIFLPSGEASSLENADLIRVLEDGLLGSLLKAMLAVGVALRLSVCLFAILRGV